ncbi:hypothetical protein FACS189423_10580 [Bacteroidia bacterium]|nr:hypothetical protein FACS189423_10580 [Bacteroidia bacterium]
MSDKYTVSPGKIVGPFYGLYEIGSDENSKDVLCSIISIIRKREEIDKKEYLSVFNEADNRLLHIVEYLRHIELGLKTIIFEFNYRDRQYIEDHSHYYNRSFKHYSRHCIRLHFFSNKFSKKEFDKLLLNLDSEENQKLRSEICKHYLGFTIIKPLPATIVGKTCLKTYKEEKKETFIEGETTKEYEGTRHYDTKRKYKVTLFGLPLKVESVAYQEQDNQMFVCATTALWVAYQCTSKLFDHKIPTPYEITLQATGRKTAGSEGLTPNEIKNSISELGMHPVRIAPYSISHTKAVLHAYLKAKIPVILGATIIPIEKDDSRENKLKKLNSDEAKDAHAITALGYDIVENRISIYRTVKEESKEKKTHLYLKSSYIRKAYVHDDQIGSFTKFRFFNERKTDFVCLESPEWNKKQAKKQMFRLDMMFIPLYHKIRVSFDKMLNITDELNTYFFSYKDDKTYAWDIHLTTICQLKEDLLNEDPNKRNHNFNNKELYQDIKLEILTSSLPKYIWVVEAYSIKERKNDFSLYFDATGMEKSNLFLFYLPYNEIIFSGFLHLLSKGLKNFNKHKKEISHQTQFLFDFFKSKDSQKQDVNIGRNIVEKLCQEIEKRI